MPGTPRGRSLPARSWAGTAGVARGPPTAGILSLVHAAPVWIQSADALRALAADLADRPVLALDTEADSLYHYPERLCLVQLATAEGQVYFLDALVLPDLEPLRPLLAGPSTVKVFHSAENDLVHLRRRFGVAVTPLFDTALAARFLGARSLGLAALLERYLGLRPEKAQQKTDWGRRPLTPAQEAYAAADVRYLIPLRARLLAELRARGREGWVLEECEALAAAPTPEPPSEEDGYLRLARASKLDPTGLAVLRALVAQREAWARAERRPPFKVLGAEVLVTLARLRPDRREGLAGIPGLTPRLIARYGEGLLAAIRQGLATPPPAPARPTGPRRPPPTAETRRRQEALRAWREATARALDLDPGVLLPQRLIEVLAADPPRDLQGLAAVPGIRRWRVEAFGSALLAALQTG